MANIEHGLDFDLSHVSKYRSELMGAATIGILMCHALAYDVNLPFHLNSVLGLGQIGVMIFFLLSGIGLYFSTRKLNGRLVGLRNWYKKRIVRIFVPYIAIKGIMVALQLIDNQCFTWGGICTNSQQSHIGSVMVEPGLYVF